MSTSDRRTRRKNGDLLPVLIARKNEFADWAYAGRPESMLAVFPKLEEDLIALKRIRDKRAKCHTDTEHEVIPTNNSAYRAAALDEYFTKIPEEIVHDARIAESYGINLKKLRMEHKYTLKRVSQALQIEYQNLDDIEKGRRKKIDRDLLVLFSGFYHVCPEDLLGIQRVSKEAPAEFVSEATFQKARYIIHRLFSDSPLLLLALLELGRLSAQKQHQFIEAAGPGLGIKVFTECQLASKIEQLKESEPIDRTPSYPLDPNKCYDILYDLEMRNPELMNIFASIATNKRENHYKILTHLINSNFLRPNM